MGKEVIVKEAMKTNLVVVKPTITVLEAAKRMKEKKIGNVIVVEKKTTGWNTYRERYFKKSCC